MTALTLDQALDRIAALEAVIKAHLKAEQALELATSDMTFVSTAALELAIIDGDAATARMRELVPIHD